MPESRQHIAIIGTGISGLGAAYLLHPYHDIAVYEKNDYIGGHSRTVRVETPDGTIPVDTAFIIFNYETYPLLSGLFTHLDVPVTKSSASSFGVSINNHWLEYGMEKRSQIFAQRRNLLRPAFWRMLADIVRFNRVAQQYLDADASVTLQDCMNALGVGYWFQEYYLLAMGGPMWGIPLEHARNFPAKAFLRFFENHGLLANKAQPQWYTVRGGSAEYVRRLAAPFADRIKLNCGVKNVIRHADHIEVIDVIGGIKTYDQVVFACHPNQTLVVLENPTPQEQDIIGCFRYQSNRIVLHSDLSFMPRRRRAWTSWVYLSETRQDRRPIVSVSYWMNNLQPLQTNMPIIATLNPGREPDESLIHDHYHFEHPIFDQSAVEAQEKIPEIQGKDRIWYCGAWQGSGFHEDGLFSAVEVAKAMGIEVSWPH